MRALPAAAFAGTAILAIAAAAAFALGPRPRAESARAPSGAATTDSGLSGGEIRSANADEGVAPSGERLETAVAPPPPPPPEPEGLEDGGFAPAPSGDFSAKYARSTPEELVRAAVELDERFLLRSDREFEARFADGRYVETRIAPGERRTTDEIVASLVAPGRLHRAQVVHAALAGARPETELSVEAVRIVELRPDELPDLYELAAERDWLRRFLAPTQR